MANFILPTLEEVIAYDEKITLKWAELPQNIVFKIIEKKEIDTPNSKFSKKSLLLTLEDKGNVVNVWATDYVTSELQKKPKARVIICRGLQNSSKNPTEGFIRSS